MNIKLKIKLYIKPENIFLDFWHCDIVFHYVIAGPDLPCVLINNTPVDLPQKALVYNNLKRIQVLDRLNVTLCVKHNVDPILSNHHSIPQSNQPSHSLIHSLNHLPTHFQSNQPTNQPTNSTHLSRVTFIYVLVTYAIVGSDNGLLPVQCHTIIWIKARSLLTGPLRTNFSEIWIKMKQHPLKKMYLKMSCAKWRPICLGLNVLITPTEPLTPVQSSPVQSNQPSVVASSYVLQLSHIYTLHTMKLGVY